MKKMNPRQLEAPKELNQPPADQAQEVEQQEATQEGSPNESAATSIELEHLQSLEVDAGLKTAFTEGSAGEGGAPAEMSQQFLSKDEFFQFVFVPAHTMPATLMKIKSLHIQPDEKESARQASDAIYDTIMDTPILHFIIKPSSVWVQRALVIWAYAAPKAAAVREEIRMKNATDITHEAA